MEQRENIIPKTLLFLNSFNEHHSNAQTPIDTHRNLLCEPIHPKKIHSRTSIYKEFKAAINSHVDNVNRDLCAPLKSMIRQINKLE